LKKRVPALERASGREERWPEIIPMDEEASQIFERHGGRQG